jgi:hypothetical protein
MSAPFIAPSQFVPVNDVQFGLAPDAVIPVADTDLTNDDPEANSKIVTVTG